MKVKQKNLSYHPGLDEQVKKAVVKALGIKVISAERMKQGEISYAYKVKTSNGTFLAKVLKFRNWPDAEALIKTSRLLAEHKILHPKILYHVRKTPDFPFGFLIQEYIKGVNCHKAILAGKISFARYHFLLGKLLRKIHNIKLHRFGRLSKPLNKQTSYAAIKLKGLKKHLDEFKGSGLLRPNVYEEIKTKVEPILLKYSSRFKPVLTHGDATPDNCVLTKDGRIVLIDWDNSKATVWLEDFTWLTYCGSHMTALGSREKRAKIIKREFFKGYGKMDLSGTDLGRIEYALHLLKAASHLGYHYFAQKNHKAFRQGLIRLNILLKKR